MRDKGVLKERNKTRNYKDGCEKQKKIGRKEVWRYRNGEKIKSRRERQLVFGGNVKKAFN